MSEWMTPEIPDETFRAMVRDIFVECQDLLFRKGEEYSSSRDRLLNFRRIAQQQDCSPLLIWSVYATKHWDAIQTFIRKNGQNHHGEAIGGRINDLINYLLLLRAFTGVEPSPQERRVPRHLPNFWYCATPYSVYPTGCGDAVRHATKLAALMLELRIPSFFPVIQGHYSNLVGLVPPSHEDWFNLNRPFMEAAHGLIVFKLPSWELSLGIKQEIEFFQSLSKPVLSVACPTSVSALGALLASS